MGEQGKREDIVIERSTTNGDRGWGTVLVTGGAGHIGSLLVRRLLDRGDRVRVLDRLLYGADALRLYRQALGDRPYLAFMSEAPWGRHTRWLTCLTIDPAAAGTDREAVRVALGRETIEVRPVRQS